MCVEILTVGSHYVKIILDYEVEDKVATYFFNSDHELLETAIIAKEQLDLDDLYNYTWEMYEG